MTPPPTEASPTPEQTYADLEATVESAHAAADRARRLVDDLAAMRVTGRSRDGQVEITLTHSGALRDLALSSGLDLRTDRVRAAVLEANADAQSRLTARVSDLCAQAYGADSATTGQVVGGYESMLTSYDDPRADATGPRRRTCADSPGLLR